MSICSSPGTSLRKKDSYPQHVGHFLTTLLPLHLFRGFPLDFDAFLNVIQLRSVKVNGKILTLSSNLGSMYFIHPYCVKPTKITG